MKIRIKEFPVGTWFGQNQCVLQNKELDVLDIVKSNVTHRESYLVKRPDKYVPARCCEIV